MEREIDRNERTLKTPDNEVLFVLNLFVILFHPQVRCNLTRIIRIVKFPAFSVQYQYLKADVDTDK